jgi:hypothetical protein
MKIIDTYILSSEIKDLVARNQDKVSERSDMYTRLDIAELAVTH